MLYTRQSAWSGEIIQSPQDSAFIPFRLLFSSQNNQLLNHWALGITSLKMFHTTMSKVLTDFSLCWIEFGRAGDDSSLMGLICTWNQNEHP